ncbi:hypothetical protein EMIT0P100_50070 [Pseudomonas sp. IT-P100]
MPRWRIRLGRRTVSEGSHFSEKECVGTSPNQPDDSRSSAVNTHVMLAKNPLWELACQRWRFTARSFSTRYR